MTRDSTWPADLDARAADEVHRDAAIFRADFCADWRAIGQVVRREARSHRLRATAAKMRQRYLSRRSSGIRTIGILSRVRRSVCAPCG